MKIKYKELRVRDFPFTEEEMDFLIENMPYGMFCRIMRKFII